VKILLVDDEASLVATIGYNLHREGHQVISAGDGERALELAAEHDPALVILDVMLPRLDGFEVCRLIRRRSAVPILMLTARTDEVDRIVGLEIGADDYLTKPFSMRELMARVKAMLRRREMLLEEFADGDATADAVTDGDLCIDIPAREVRLGEQPLRLKPREYDLLLFLMRHRGRVFSAATLMRRVWGHEHIADTGTVPVHVRSLRKKIEAEPSAPRRIVTVRGAGYRYSA
jgi:DNA-binding response OmpR family regulator